MADLFKKKNLDAEAVEAPVEEKAEKKEKKQKNKLQYLEHNTMNFLERYETVVEGKAADKGLEAYKKPIMILMIALVVIGVIAQGLNIYSGMRIKSLEKYINDENNKASYNQSLETKAAADAATLQKTNLEANLAAIASYPDVDKKLFDAIANAATANGVTLGTYGYSGSTGYIAISGCTAPSPASITEFIRAAETTGLFVDFEYQGFSGAGEGGGYSYNVSFYLAAPITE